MKTLSALILTFLTNICFGEIQITHWRTEPGAPGGMAFKITGTIDELPPGANSHHLHIGVPGVIWSGSGSGPPIIVNHGDSSDILIASIFSGLLSYQINPSVERGTIIYLGKKDALDAPSNWAVGDSVNATILVNTGVKLPNYRTLNLQQLIVSVGRLPDTSVFPDIRTKVGRFVASSPSVEINLLPPLNPGNGDRVNIAFEGWLEWSTDLVNWNDYDYRIHRNHTETKNTSAKYYRALSTSQ